MPIRNWSLLLLLCCCCYTWHLASAHLPLVPKVTLRISIFFSPCSNRLAFHFSPVLICLTWPTGPSVDCLFGGIFFSPGGRFTPEECDWFCPNLLLERRFRSNSFIAPILEKKKLGPDDLQVLECVGGTPANCFWRAGVVWKSSLSAWPPLAFHWAQLRMKWAEIKRVENPKQLVLVQWVAE